MWSPHTTPQRSCAFIVFNFSSMAAVSLQMQSACQQNKTKCEKLEAATSCVAVCLPCIFNVCLHKELYLSIVTETHNTPWGKKPAHHASLCAPKRVCLYIQIICRSRVVLYRHSYHDTIFCYDSPVFHFLYFTLLIFGLPVRLLRGPWSMIQWLWRVYVYTNIYTYIYIYMYIYIYIYK